LIECLRRDLVQLRQVTIQHDLAATNDVNLTLDDFQLNGCHYLEVISGADNSRQKSGPAPPTHPMAPQRTPRSISCIPKTRVPPARGPSRRSRRFSRLRPRSPKLRIAPHPQPIRREIPRTILAHNRSCKTACPRFRAVRTPLRRSRPAVPDRSSTPSAAAV
jgi:hypothetical protein